MAEKLVVYEINDFDTKNANDKFYFNTLAEHFSKHPFVTKPHRHDFYIIVYFSSGTGIHTIDFMKYIVSPGSIFFLFPGQVHNWSLSPETEGRILFFKKEFIEDYFNKKITSFPLFHAKYQLHQIDNKKIKEQLSGLLEDVEREYQNESVSLEVIRDYLDILIIKLGFLFLSSENISSSPGIWHIQKLDELIDESYMEHRPPAFYAKELNFSVKYLNDLCKKYLNKTTSQLIHDRIILEAKRLLTHDDLSIKEIADRLNFEDHAYFTRLFKKIVGTTPGAFRIKMKSD